MSSPDSLMVEVPDPARDMFGQTSPRGAPNPNVVALLFPRDDDSRILTYQDDRGLLRIPDVEADNGIRVVRESGLVLEDPSIDQAIVDQVQQRITERTGLEVRNVSLLGLRSSNVIEVETEQGPSSDPRRVLFYGARANLLQHPRSLSGKQLEGFGTVDFLDPGEARHGLLHQTDDIGYSSVRSRIAAQLLELV